MSQNDFNIANQGFPSFRADLNDALQALASNNAGAAEPSTTYANQWWYDTTASLLKLRNEANTDWVAPNFGEISNVNITGGTIDGAVIGGVAPAAVTTSSLVVNGNNYPSAGALSNRNLIINGAMQVAQRGVSFTANGYGLDRWVLQSNNTTPTVTQETGVFATGGKSIKMITDASNDYAYVAQKVEDLSYFSGKTITVSFDYKATNNFWLQFEYHYGSGGSVSEFTKHQTAISSSATATRASVTVTIDDLSAKTFGSASTSHLNLLFNSEITNPTTVEITNVQLEVGDTSTPFEHRSYGQELALCQRYYQRFTCNQYSVVGIAIKTKGSDGRTQVRSTNVPMRAAPTGTVESTSTPFLANINSGVNNFTSLRVETYTPEGWWLAGTISQIDGLSDFYEQGNSGATHYCLDSEL